MIKKLLLTLSIPLMMSVGAIGAFANNSGDNKNAPSTSKTDQWNDGQRRDTSRGLSRVPGSTDDTMDNEDTNGLNYQESDELDNRDNDSEDSSNAN